MEFDSSFQLFPWARFTVISIDHYFRSINDEPTGVEMLYESALACTFVCTFIPTGLVRESVSFECRVGYYALDLSFALNLAVGRTH